MELTYDKLVNGSYSGLISRNYQFIMLFHYLTKAFHGTVSQDYALFYSDPKYTPEGVLNQIMVPVTLIGVPEDHMAVVAMLEGRIEVGEWTCAAEDEPQDCIALLKEKLGTTVNTFTNYSSTGAALRAGC